MSGCDFYQELISRMLDEDLSRDERAALAEHLGTCRECTAMYQAFSALSDTVASDLVEPPEDLTDNIMAELRRAEIVRQNGRTTRLSRPMKNLIAAAACVALVVAAVGGVAVVNNRKSDAAIYESRTSIMTSGKQSAVEESAASVTAPTPTPAPAATVPPMQSYTVPDVPDSENYGYVPEKGNGVQKSVASDAPVQFPDFMPSPTPAPTSAPTPTSVPAPTAMPTPEPTAEPTPPPSSAEVKLPYIEATDAPIMPPVAEPTEEPAQSPELQPSANNAASSIVGEPVREQPTETQAPAANAATEGEETGAANDGVNIARSIDLTGIDTTELFTLLFANADDDEKTDAEQSDAQHADTDTSAGKKNADEDEKVLPPEPAEAAQSEPVGDKPPVVSVPTELDEKLRKLIPEDITPELVDVLCFTLDGEENTAIVCICDDAVQVFAYDDGDIPLSYTPGLSAEDYLKAIEPFIRLAEAALSEETKAE